MSINERLQMVIKMNDMTNAAFADKIGVQRSSISHVLAGRNKPSVDFIQKILKNFPKVDPGWLITGERVGKTSQEQNANVDKDLVESFSSSDKDLDGQIVGEPSELKSQTFEDKVSDEGPLIYGGKIIGKACKNNNSDQEDRKIDQIIVFYNDGTYETLSS
ncbi:hypothetical protein CW751_03885 [Brumimicrobium salinarum]|uniref:HTH cro/C1-type domain-containing protein n=1 Tax=Brumimicrobium salinarum TaxID=2058658 RepID=A0A2I0R516_9FLAO|nr:helix-turn-helix transcriptional regulator [Brumimicrobium salinarum]PKR81676.1 hypothetical protein CW751_03885 [Brumimicrobium salinarum]